MAASSEAARHTLNLAGTIESFGEKGHYKEIEYYYLLTYFGISSNIALTKTIIVDKGNSSAEN